VISLSYAVSLLLFIGNVAVPIGLSRDGSVEQAQTKGKTMPMKSSWSELVRVRMGKGESSS